MTPYEEEESLEYLKPRKLEKKVVSKATSKRAYFIELTANMLKVPFKVVLWKTINWPEEWIFENYENAMKNGSPPARLWNGLYKKSKNETHK